MLNIWKPRSLICWLNWCVTIIHVWEKCFIEDTLVTYDSGAWVFIAPPLHSHGFPSRGFFYITCSFGCIWRSFLDLLGFESLKVLFFQWGHASIQNVVLSVVPECFSDTLTFGRTRPRGYLHRCHSIILTYLKAHHKRHKATFHSNNITKKIYQNTIQPHLTLITWHQQHRSTNKTTSSTSAPQTALACFQDRVGETISRSSKEVLEDKQLLCRKKRLPTETAWCGMMPFDFCQFVYYS